jgi:hypothetical protein
MWRHHWRELDWLVFSRTYSTEDLLPCMVEDNVLCRLEVITEKSY